MHDWPTSLAEALAFWGIALIIGGRLAQGKGFSAIFRSAAGCWWRLPFNAFALGLLLFAWLEWLKRIVSIPMHSSIEKAGVDAPGNPVATLADVAIDNATVTSDIFSTSAVVWGLVLATATALIFSTIVLEVEAFELLERGAGQPNATQQGETPSLSTVGKANESAEQKNMPNAFEGEVDSVYNARLLSLILFLAMFSVTMLLWVGI